MKRTLLTTVLALVATVAVAGTGGISPPMPVSSRPSEFQPVGADANYAILEVGARAPDFSFDSQGRQLRLRDLRAQGHVLLVFEPDDERMLSLERERTRLFAIGVVPVAVLDQRASACAATAHRLGLGYSLIPDPRRVIGAQFNALDPLSRGDAPAWFVLDTGGRIRELAHQSWPAETWSTVSARALGLPGPDAAAPASLSRH